MEQIEAPTWHIQLLGGLEVRQGETAIAHFPTRKAAALLAWLAFYGQRAHARDLLAEMLWPDEAPETMRDRFRQALSALRRILEPEGVPAGSVLFADRNEVRLTANCVQTDVTRFEWAIRCATRTERQSERLPYLVQAIEVYQGELLPGYYDDWILRERDRLAERAHNAMLEAAGLLAQQGDIEQALAIARRAVDIDGLHEEAHACLMRLYARAGRSADVVRQYRQFEKVLREEIEQAPSIAFQQLFGQLFGQLQEVAPAVVSPSPVLERVSPALATGRQMRVTGDYSTPQPSPTDDSHIKSTADPIAETGRRTGTDKEFNEQFSATRLILEPEGGAVPLDSKFYLTRSCDEEFAEAVTRGDSIVLVKGARQAGKTSLLARGLQQARESGKKVVLTDIQKLTSAQMQSADHLFRAITDTMIDALDLDLDIDAVWKPQRGWNVNFERFLRRQVLGSLDTHLIWGLDEVDRLFAYPYSADVFGLFRSWHNERSLDPSGPWSRFTLAIAYATAAHLFITDLNQSPFNVGTRLTLSDFTVDEVVEMNRRYASPLRSLAEVTRLYDLIGGNPYLVRRSLNALSTAALDLDGLELQFDRDDGVFTDPLRRMLTALRQDETLCQAVIQMLRGQACPTAESFYRLQSAGVVVGASLHDARFRCQLYQRYLETHLL